MQTRHGRIAIVRAVWLCVNVAVLGSRCPSHAERVPGASGSLTKYANTTVVRQAATQLQGIHAPLSVVEGVLTTTAAEDFNGHERAFAAAANWDGRRLSDSGCAGPHLACASYDKGKQALSSLEKALSSLSSSVRVVSHSREHGSCFVATAWPAHAAFLSSNLEKHHLESFGVFPSLLKLAPGLLEFAQDGDNSGEALLAKEGSPPSKTLSTIHGTTVRMENVGGLNLELSPGLLPAHDVSAVVFIDKLLGELTATSLNLHAINFWSDPKMLQGDNKEHLEHAAGALRAREWTRAADVVHKLAVAEGKEGSLAPGDICSWDGLRVHHAENDILMITGVFGCHPWL